MALNSRAGQPDWGVNSRYYFNYHEIDEKHKRILQTLIVVKNLIVLFLYFASFPLFGAEGNFIRIKTGDGASIQIPKNWSIINNSARTTLDASVEARGIRSPGPLPFAANLYDENGKTLATVNIRVYQDSRLTQENCENLTEQQIKEMRDLIEKETRSSLSLLGVKDAVFESATKRSVSGLCAIQHAHYYSLPTGKERIRETRLRIWAAPRSYTVAVAYNLRQEFILQPISNNILGSFLLE